MYTAGDYKRNKSLNWYALVCAKLANTPIPVLIADPFAIMFAAHAYDSSAFCRI